MTDLELCAMEELANVTIVVNDTPAAGAQIILRTDGSYAQAILAAKVLDNNEAAPRLARNLTNLVAEHRAILKRLEVCQRIIADQDKYLKHLDAKELE